MKKKLSCGLLALSLAFSASPSIPFGGVIPNIGSVDVSADDIAVIDDKTALVEGNFTIAPIEYTTETVTESKLTITPVAVDGGSTATVYSVTDITSPLSVGDEATKNNKATITAGETDAVFTGSIEVPFEVTTAEITESTPATLKGEYADEATTIADLPSTITVKTATNTTGFEVAVTDWTFDSSDGAFSITDGDINTFTANFDDANCDFTTNNVTATANVTVGAEATLSGTTITFDVDGTTTTADTIANGTVTFPSNPTKDGFTFKGWYTAATGGTEVASTNVFESETTVYAQWTAVEVPQTKKLTITLSNTTGYTNLFVVVGEVGKATTNTSDVHTAVFEDISTETVTVTVYNGTDATDPTTVIAIKEVTLSSAENTETIAVISKNVTITTPAEEITDDASLDKGEKPALASKVEVTVADIISGVTVTDSASDVVVKLEIENKPNTVVSQDEKIAIATTMVTPTLTGATLAGSIPLKLTMTPPDTGTVILVKIVGNTVTKVNDAVFEAVTPANNIMVMNAADPVTVSFEYDDSTASYALAVESLEDATDSGTIRTATTALDDILKSETNLTLTFTPKNATDLANYDTVVVDVDATALTWDVDDAIESKKLKDGVVYNVTFEGTTKFSLPATEYTAGTSSTNFVLEEVPKSASFTVKLEDFAEGSYTVSIGEVSKTPISEAGTTEPFNFNVLTAGSNYLIVVEDENSTEDNKVVAVKSITVLPDSTTFTVNGNTDAITQAPSGTNVGVVSGVTETLTSATTSDLETDHYMIASAANFDGNEEYDFKSNGKKHSKVSAEPVLFFDLSVYNDAGQSVKDGYKSVDMSIVLADTLTLSNPVVIHYNDDGSVKTVYSAKISGNTLTFTITQGFSIFGLAEGVSSGSISPPSTPSTSGGGSTGSYSSASSYHESGSIPTTGYIPEFRGVLLGEMINLDKIDVNGMEIEGWYYDTAFTQPVSNTATFVVTSDVIANGLYPKFVNQTSTDNTTGNDYTGSTGSTGSTGNNNTYVPSTVPSTWAKLLGKLF